VAGRVHQHDRRVGHGLIRRRSHRTRDRRRAIGHGDDDVGEAVGTDSHRQPGYVLAVERDPIEPPDRRAGNLDDM
jgi:hypothetical protein